MFNEIGKKIKTVAIVLFIIVAIGSIIAGGYLIFRPGEYYDSIKTPDYITGVIIILCGIISSLISSWILYGFGELIEKVTEIAKNTNKTNNNANAQNDSSQSSFSAWVSKNNATKIDSDTWTCPNCGQKNANIRTVCLKCGNEINN